MNLEKFNNCISINKIIDANHINKICDITPKYKKVLNTVLLSAPYFSNKCNDKNAYSGGLSIEEIFQIIYKRKYSLKNSQDKNKYENIQSILNKLSGKKNYIDNEKELVGVYNKEGVNYYYIKNYKNQGFCKIEHPSVPLGTCKITLDNYNKYNNPMDFITCAMVILATQNKVIFNYNQIEKIFGITKSRFRSTLKKMCAYIGNTKKRNGTSREKKLYDYNKKDTLNIIDGVMIYHFDEYTINEIINDFSIDINWDCLYKIRMFFIKNYNTLYKNSFTCTEKVLTKETFENIIKIDDGHEYSKFYRIDCEINNKTGKMKNKQNLHKSYGTKDFYADKRKELIENDLCKNVMSNNNDVEEADKLRCADNVAEDAINNEPELFDIDFKDFCEAIRNNFKEFLEETKDLNSWREFKELAILQLKESNYMNKEKFIAAFESVKKNRDILSSPLFCDDWISNCDESEMMLYLMYHSWDNSISKKMEEENISETEFIGIVNLLYDDIVKDIENFNKENYLKMIKEKTNGIELSKKQLESLDSRIEVFESMKTLHEVNNFGKNWDFNDCLLYTLEKDFDSFEKYMEIMDDLIFQNSRNENVLYLLKTIVRFLNQGISQQFKTLLPDNNKKSNIILNYLEKREKEIIEEKKTQKPDKFQLIKKQLTEELAKKGYTINNSKTLAQTIKIMAMKIYIHKLDINKVIDDFVNGKDLK